MQTITKIKDKWGKTRPAILIKCPKCGTEKLMRKFVGRPNMFCSSVCGARFRFKDRTTKLPCVNCNTIIVKSLIDIKPLNFCSRICKESYQSNERHPNWNGGLGTYRHRAIRHYGLKCAILNCPVRKAKIPAKPSMFDVDHINGERNDNTLKNLQILCVWCHRIKTLGL